MLLFFHGAGGYEDDRPLADELGLKIGASVTMPHIPDDDMSYEAWARVIRTHVQELGPDDYVAAHSFGASVLLRVLAEGDVAFEQAVLLAMPEWSPDGWDVPEYMFDGPEPAVQLKLHHCGDDDVVPIAHLALHAARLPSSRIIEHPSGGHQFDGVVDAIAADIRATTI